MVYNFDEAGKKITPVVDCCVLRKIITIIGYLA